MIDAEPRRVDVDVLTAMSRHVRARTGEPLSAAVTAMYGGHLTPTDRVLTSPDLLPACRAAWAACGLRGPAPVASVSASAAVLAAATRSYVDQQFGVRPRSRFLGVLGSAPLGRDFWAGLAAPVHAGVTLVVEASDGIAERFEKAGWHVAEVKYGPQLRKAFVGWDGLREWLDSMSPDRLRALGTMSGPELRLAFLDGAPATVWSMAGTVDDDELTALLGEISDDDAGDLITAFKSCAGAGAPGVVLVHTNARRVYVDGEPPRAPAAATTAPRPPRAETIQPARVAVPSQTSAHTSRPTSTHAAVLRSLRALTADPTLARHLVVLDEEDRDPLPSLEQLGLAYRISGQPLLAVGVADDPRSVSRASAVAATGARFIVAGRETALVAPYLTMLEPAYAVAVDWLLCSALAQITGPAPGAVHLRVTKRPLDQQPFETVRARIGDAVLRHLVLGGAYRLLDAGRGPGPTVQIAVTGPLMPEALLAAAELADEGVRAHVIDVVSPSRLYADWQDALRRAIGAAAPPSLPGALRQAFEPRTPVVTVHDAQPHALAWLGSALAVPSVPVPVPELTAGSIVNAALAALASGSA